MSILLYDLCGADEDRRFSPYCWRTKMALMHKGLAFDTEPVRFGTFDKIAFSGRDKVPVLVDGDTTIGESFDIACYLEDAYPDRPSLFGGAIGRAEARFLSSWADTVMIPAGAPLYVLDIFENLHEDDKPYFRETREKRFGTTLEQFCSDLDAKAAAFRRALAPLRATLAAQDFVCGDAPAYGDYVMFGSLAGSRTVSPFKQLEPDDPVHAWRGRMLDLFAGYAASAKGYPV
jgi:glutathione S-transferase